MSVCPLCHTQGLQPLPIPHPTQAVISDGRIFPAALAKSYCPACGAVSHSKPLTANDVRRFYDADYDLGAETSQADAARNQSYAQRVREWVGDGIFSNVLEVGCGSGQTLQALADVWPNTQFLGIEAAAQLATGTNSPRIEIRQAFAEDLPAPEQPFDLIFSINVIEHTADPAIFLKALADQLAPGGQLLLICPTTAPPNLELMFLDHVHSFSQNSLSRLAATAGLSVHKGALEPEGLSGFQVCLLAAGDPKEGKDIPTMSEASAYLSAWQNLDDNLLAQTTPDASIDLFGAGEVAALLRCYAPRIWARVNRILVDDAAGARNLGKPVMTLAEIDAPADFTLIATHPRAQTVIASRLRTTGHNPIVFNNLIPR